MKQTADRAAALGLRLVSGNYSNTSKASKDKSAPTLSPALSPRSSSTQPPTRKGAATLQVLMQLQKMSAEQIEMVEVVASAIARGQL